MVLYLPELFNEERDKLVTIVQAAPSPGVHSCSASWSRHPARWRTVLQLVLFLSAYGLALQSTWTLFFELYVSMFQLEVITFSKFPIFSPFPQFSFGMPHLN